MKVTKCLRLFVLVAVAAWIPSPSLLGQILNTGTFLGTVRDSSGASVPGVTVRLVRESPAFTQVVTTDDGGKYLVPGVPIGDYRIEFEKGGFKRLLRSGVQLSAGQSLLVDGELQVGAVSESVNVSAAVAQVDTATANLGSTVSGKQVQELLLSTRSFTQLVALEPGVSIGTSSSAGQQPGFASNSTVPYSFNGAGTFSNNWLLDGGRNVDVFNGNQPTLVNLDAIAEVYIERNAYSSEYGRNGGAQINVITKSGSNAFHGSLFEFFRNDKLDARNFFAVAKPKTRWNNFGGTLGGPIKKDKLFFFLSNEYRRIRQVASIRTSIVPTTAQVAGDFSGGRTITDPDSGLPFSGNRIPTSRLDPNAQILLKNYYPPPTPGFLRGALNFSSAEPDGTQYRSGLGRIDYNIHPNLTFFGRYNIDGTVVDSPYGLFGSNALPAITASQQVSVVYTTNGSLNWNIRPNLVNNFMAAFYSSSFPISVTPATSRVRFPNFNVPRIFDTQTDSSGLIPAISMAQGYAGIATLWPEQIRGYSFELRNNVSYIKGRHFIKVGVSIDKENKTQDNNNANNNGTFSFNGSITGDSVADLLLGRVFQYTEASHHPVIALNWTNVGLYLQDQFQAHPRLTLTYGLRWEFFPPEQGDGHISFFDPARFDFSKAATVLSNGQIVTGTQNFGNGLVVAGSGAPYGNAATNTTYNTFAPRAGFSYALTKNKLTVLRGGYGIFHDRWPQFAAQAVGNPPFSQTVSIFNTNFSNPAQGSLRVFPVSLASFESPWDIPYLQKWSLGLQRQLPRDLLLDVSYVGSKGTHLIRSQDLNQSRPSVAVATSQVSPNAVRPYPGFSSISTFGTSANSSYHSLQASLVRRFSAGLSIQASYTFSKSIDNNTGAINPYASSRLERALSGFDRTHMLIMSYVWELPFARHAQGWRARGLGGWELSGINSYQSGLPGTVAGNIDWAGIGRTGQRPNVVGVATPIKTFARWFDTAAFAAPALGTFGNAGRSLVRAPGMNNWNLAAIKKMQLRENMRLQFRAEFFNIFNHTQYSGVGTTFGAASFGQVTAALDPRITQLALRLNF